MAFETISLGTQPAGTGGDTARTAFEKVNRNFIAADVLAAAMSQAQFEANRNANKELYAASGWVSFGNHESGKQVNECKPGLYTALTTPNTLLIGKTGGVGGSKTDHGVLCIAGVIFDLPLAYQVRLAQAPDGKTTYNKSTGVITNHATVAAAFNAQAADPVNVEVVINRVDMWGFEAFPQEVTITNPEIYPHGVFSDLFTSMNGIPTSDSARPVSYFGFLGKKAKKVDFFALSNAQKKKVLADPKNNLYYSDNGQLIQWVLRGREFAGAGNGDWENIDPSAVIGNDIYLQFSTNKVRFQPQGVRELPNNSPWGYPIYIGSQTADSPSDMQLGGYACVSSSKTFDPDSSFNGECYFLICGTVNRLNSGGYHLSFNQSGTRRYAGDGGHWFNTSQSILTTSDTFSKSLQSTGYIGAPSGHPLDRSYESIYAGGNGGVCRDMRYSVYGVDEFDSSEADQRVKNGTYRGFEKNKITTVLSSVDSNMSVGCNFLVTEVIATDAAINATAALSGGWSGFRNARKPTGDISVFWLSRYAVSTPTALRSTNNGSSWTIFTPTFNPEDKSVTLINEPATNIVILQYQAFAKTTEGADNADVYGYNGGVGNLLASNGYSAIDWAALLCESMLDIVLTGMASGVLQNNFKLLDIGWVDSRRKLRNDSFSQTSHKELTIGPPSNNSRGFKALNYNVNINQQAFIQYAYTELKHNGTNWGDDGKVTIVDNQSTKTDLNGNTVLVGTAKLKEPIGWIKNKV
ncbi:hypothetical protein [Shewanella baltica]|uniref:hypothetical protein n=1 Tax=Shewanella baltica TaxID=62322 RepID=UPI00217D5DFD|nr:hypothetical protein [Shewanella baltica]MCS6175374.1 hypothetical protein [Shewanella baltica]